MSCNSRSFSIACPLAAGRAHLFERLRAPATLIAFAAVLLFSSVNAVAADAAGAASPQDIWRADAKKMKLGIIIYSTDAEVVWNAFRFGGFALKKGDSVKVFLLAKGVECERLNTKDFDVTGMMKSFVESGGQIQAYGTCLTLRNSKGTELCPISTMKDMYDIVRGCDKVLTF